jgi:uncharacterized protein YegP (UPF0339 family)
MATATKKARKVGQPGAGARRTRVKDSLQFLVVEDNGGDYHWRIVAGDGARLAQSASFDSYDDAAQAAQQVRDGAASARLEQRPVIT